MPGDSWRRRTATVAALAFPVVAGVVALAGAATYDQARVVDGPTAKWQTIEYEGIRVEIPGSWHRADLGDCEFDFEHWTPAADDACGDGPGVSFFASATFDPATGPGLRRPEPGAGPGQWTGRWSGYVTVDDTAIDVSAVHRGIARRVLASVETAGAVR